VKEILAKIIFVLLDLSMIFFSIVSAFALRSFFDTTLEIHTIPIETYYSFYPIYIIPIVLFAYEGIYTYHYDFWHESRLIFKAIIFSAILIFAYLAMTKSIEEYSRLVIGFTFIFMTFLIPMEKNISKKLLRKWGLWRKRAAIYGDDPFLTAEIYGNPYLGYVRPKNDQEPATIFVNSKGNNPQQLKKLLSEQIKQKHEVIFVPLMDDYDLTHSHIYELSNTRTNLIVYQNRLKSRYRKIFQQTYNYILAVILLPLILPLIGIFAILIKRESEGPVFFAHHRIGQDGKTIPTYKFRSMYKDAEERLKRLLEEDPAAKEEWEKSYKLKDDPRVTKIGSFLRRTSLDELPQIFNVLRGEMNFVGPRPVIQEEIEKYYKEDAEYYFMVKPGITGLWQVSGRSDTDYEFRVATDKWYVSNWSLWLDIIILLKTVKVVLKKDGAY
jgi:undecaprenyl-phosphate galactose phosphotransferase